MYKYINIIFHPSSAECFVVLFFCPPLATSLCVFTLFGTWKSILTDMCSHNSLKKKKKDALSNHTDAKMSRISFSVKSAVVHILNTLPPLQCVHTGDRAVTNLAALKWWRWVTIKSKWCARWARSIQLMCIHLKFCNNPMFPVRACMCFCKRATGRDRAD